MADEVEITIDDAIQEFEAAITGFREDEDYYEARERDFAVGISTPPAMRDLLAQVGIPRIYVDALVDRLHIEGFRNGGSAEADKDLWTWFKANNLSTGSQMLHRDFLVYGRGYVTVAASDTVDSEDQSPMQIPDIPIIRVESPKDLYAEIDPRTQEVSWAVRVVKNDDGDIVAATLYFKDRTELYESVEGELVPGTPISHGLGVVPVIPFVHTTSSGDLYGSSAITPEIRSITDAMSRTMMNMQTTSEIMATPQRIIFGSSVDEIQGEARTGLELYTASYIAVEDPSGSAMQLPAAELRNYTEALGFMLKMAAGYTGLPPQYLSTQTDNPASAEAINSSESRLVRTSETFTEMLGDYWEQVMRVAKLVNGAALTLDDFRMETVWRNPATPTYQAMADATTKMYASGQGVIPLEQARIDMGYTFEQREQMRVWDLENPMAQLGAMYGQGATQPPPTEPSEEVTDAPGGTEPGPGG